jgi:hypothetical protein
MNGLGFRNIWISLAVTMIPLPVLMVLVPFSDEARAIIVGTAYIASMVILNVLDHRELRRRGVV